MRATWAEPGSPPRKACKLQRSLVPRQMAHSSPGSLQLWAVAATPHCSLSWVARGDPQAQAKWRCAALFLGHFVKGSQARHWQKN